LTWINHPGAVRGYAFPDGTGMISPSSPGGWLGFPVFVHVMKGASLGLNAVLLGSETVKVLTQARLPVLVVR